MAEKYLLSIDQGTTGTKVVLYDRGARACASGYRRHAQHYPKPGWTEHDAEEIWECVQASVREALERGGILPAQIEAIGLANQGETVLFWDDFGRPLHQAVVWSCRRSQTIAEGWAAQAGWSEKVRRKTGLRIDPYFSATKIRWMIEASEDIRRHIRDRRARCSTLDAWLIWRMTGGRVYATDPSTAARTMLYNIHENDWDDEIMDFLEIDRGWLPKVLPTAGELGVTSGVAFCGIEAPILASLVDQPAALFGHGCEEPGMAKCTYGTGCFVYMNTGSAPAADSGALLSTIAWRKGGETAYALDGAVYSAGSSVDWAMNELALFDSLKELGAWSEEWYCRLLRDGGGELPQVWFAPCLSGAGAPYWDSDYRGMFLGLSHGTSKSDMAKGVLEGIAQRVADVLEEMQQVSAAPIAVLRADGGLSQNPYLMQVQADLIGKPVEVPGSCEATALGAALLAGEACGWWGAGGPGGKISVKRTYVPRLGASDRRRIRERWAKAMRLIGEFYAADCKKTGVPLS